MSAPRVARALLRLVAPRDRVEDALGDLEEGHRRAVVRHGRRRADLRTALEALDLTRALLWVRLVTRFRAGDRLAGGSTMFGSGRFGRPAGARGPRIGISSLDFKLGLRLLRKYPGLTVVGGLAMAFAIAVGAGAFEIIRQVVDPELPLPEGDRIVALHNRDVTAPGSFRQDAADLVRWRESLTAVIDVGAFRTLERNLIVGEGPAHPVQVAEISASAFRVARVPALIGRTLVDADEQPGAPPVLVLGHEVWRTRFDGDAGVVGRVVRLGDAVTTIVGVMPEDFAFPIAHRLWLPLRIEALPEAGAGIGLRVFGRLAPGESLERAQAELSALGQRAAAESPQTHEHLRPEVRPYAESVASVLTLDLPPSLRPVMYAVNFFFVMLLVLICANVALLMFARAATREAEIVVRNALGASRRRIIAQLFAEALVLGAAAAAVGLAAARLVLAGWLRVYELESGGRLPFWFDDTIAPVTVLYTVALTLLGAAVAGVIPGMKMTGRGGEARLRTLSAGGGGPRFGGLWTAVIVAQVAVTVAFPATTFLVHRLVAGVQSLSVGFPAGEYLSARLEGDEGVVVQDYRELERRLEAEPAVLAVSFAERLPRTHHPARWMELDDAEGAAIPPPGHRVSNVGVDLDWFDALSAPITAGRGFHSADLDPAARVVIANDGFVQRVLGGRNPIGRRVRFAAPPGTDPGPWYEIVGVVPDLGMVDDIAKGAGLYHPAHLDAAQPLHIAVRVRGDPAAFAPRLGAIALDIDPTLRLYDIMPLDAVGSSLWLELAFLFKLLVGVSAIALLLSLAGIYAVTAFAVARRTREIGIRIALGSDARSIVATLFRRPLAQVGLGILAGGLLVAALSSGILSGLTARHAAVIVAYAILMLGVCMLACIVPARRALRIEPTEAFRFDG